MKIEQISENQIKCTLNRADLASRQIRISELAYGTEKTRGLFQDMMDQAFMEFGFEASDDPLMIEAIPVSMDCIVLMITKVEEPDEMDTDFSALSNISEWLSSEDDAPVHGLFDLPLTSFQNDAPVRKPGAVHAAAKRTNGPATAENIFSFGSLFDVISFAHSAGSDFAGTSSLYRSPSDGRYYLILVNISDDTHTYSRICDAAMEYGSKEPSGFARSAFIREHFRPVIRDKALQNLANV